MVKRDWTVPRIIDVLVSGVIALPLTVIFWLLTILQVSYSNDHVVNCLPPGTPEPGDPWVCYGNRFTVYQWLGWTSFVLWLVIVWGGMALSLRRGWWLAAWPLLGLAMFWGIQVLEVRATEWHTVP